MAMGTLAADLVHGFRALRQRPGLTAAAVVSLALGIGAGTAIYSLIDATLLHPLAVAEPARLAAITSDSFSYPSYRDFRDQSHAFSGLACAGWRGIALASEAGEPTLVTAEVVSGNYFNVLGVRTLRGRTFLPADDRPGAAPVAVVGEALARRLGVERAAVGRTLVLNGQPFTVVGIAPGAFRGIRLSEPADLWLPIGVWPRVATGRLAQLKLDQRGWSWLGVFGRLVPGVSLARAEAEIGVLARRELRAYPNDLSENFSGRLGLLGDAAAGPESRGGLLGFFGLLAALVGIALGVACANVANLLLVRAVERRREMGIRVALGAGRWRLVRQLLTESTLLSLLGGAAALPVAVGTLRLLARFELPGGISPGQLGISGLGGGTLAPSAFGFALLLALATGLLFGLAPALQASRPDPAAVLADRSTGARAGSRLRDLLAAAQIALCLPLLIGAGLFLRSLDKSLAADPGFTVDRVAVAALDLGLARSTAPQAAAFRHDLAERLAASPGVGSTSWATMVPIEPGRETESLAVEGYRPGPGEESSVDMSFVAPGYFHTLGIPLLAGRDFAAADGEAAARVAIVNRAMARRYWPGRNPIGRTLRIVGERTTVVGVAEDSRYHSLAESPQPYLYLAMAQNPVEAGLGRLWLLVRTTGDPAAVLPMLRQAVAGMEGIGRRVPIVQVETLAQHLGALLLPQRFAATLLDVLGLLTLVLAGVGIYGVVAYAVGRRTREIGVRMALGAGMGEILRLVLGGGALRIALGLAAGLAAAAGVSRLAAGFLYGVSALDPASFVGAALLLAAVAFGATWLPARRAARIDPAIALRRE